MNYNGAPGLEFGGGNIKIDPSVAAGEMSHSPEFIYSLLNNIQNYQKAVEWYLLKAMASVSGLILAVLTSIWPTGHHNHFLLRSYRKSVART